MGRVGSDPKLPLKIPVPSGFDHFDTNLSKFSKCSNFFVFQNYDLRFSVIFHPVLIRSFPGSFAIWGIPRGTIGGIRGT